MVWKQDLAQLKQQLKPDPEPKGPPASPPKPVQAPPVARQSLEDADLLFLQAMGGVAVPPSTSDGNPLQETDTASPIAAIPRALICQGYP